MMSKKWRDLFAIVVASIALVGCGSQAPTSSTTVSLNGPITPSDTRDVAQDIAFYTHLQVNRCSFVSSDPVDVSASAGTYGVDNAILDDPSSLKPGEVLEFVCATASKPKQVWFSWWTNAEGLAPEVLARARVPQNMIDSTATTSETATSGITPPVTYSVALTTPNAAAAQLSSDIQSTFLSSGAIAAASAVCTPPRDTESVGEYRCEVVFVNDAGRTWNIPMAFSMDASGGATQLPGTATATNTGSGANTGSSANNSSANTGSGTATSAGATGINDVSWLVQYGYESPNHPFCEDGSCEYVVPKLGSCAADWNPRGYGYDGSSAAADQMLICGATSSRVTTTTATVSSATSERSTPYGVLCGTVPEFPGAAGGPNASVYALGVACESAISLAKTWTTGDFTPINASPYEFILDGLLCTETSNTATCGTRAKHVYVAVDDYTSSLPSP